MTRISVAINGRRTISVELGSTDNPLDVTNILAAELDQDRVENRNDMRMEITDDEGHRTVIPGEYLDTILPESPGGISPLERMEEMERHEEHTVKMKLEDLEFTREEYQLVKGHCESVNDLAICKMYLIMMFDRITEQGNYDTPEHSRSGKELPPEMDDFARRVKRCTTMEELDVHSNNLEALVKVVGNEMAMRDVLGNLRGKFSEWYNLVTYDVDMKLREGLMPEIKKIKSIIDKLDSKVVEPARKRKEKIKKKKERQTQAARKIKNTPDTRSWFKIPMGFEYTFHMKQSRRKNNDDWGLRERTVKQFTAALKDAVDQTGRKYTVERVYSDAGPVVEVCSPVHRTWSDMKWWYNVISKVADENGLKAWRKKKGGGGGHLNVSIPQGTDEFMTLFMFNLLVDVTNRPYLNWIFNDCSDDHTANSPWGIHEVSHLPDSPKIKVLCKEFLSEETLSSMEFHFGESDENPKRKKKPAKPTKMKVTFDVMQKFLATRASCLRVKDKSHFEFRFFDMVRSVRDVEDEVRFVNAWISKIAADARAGIVTKKDPRMFIDQANVAPNVPGRFSQNTTSFYPEFVPIAKAEFAQMLQGLGLDYANYRRFVERNFERRIRPPYGTRKFMR